MTTSTIYVSIGNSDDKLTQDDWCHFCCAVVSLIRMETPTVHGEWYSKSGAPWQNMCICFEIPTDRADAMKAALRVIAADHCQDSIAWAVAATEFLKPDPSVKRPYAVTLRRRTPEQRRAYLVEHRDEAIAKGILPELVDQMIQDAEEVLPPVLTRE